jgi:Na+-transporting NADH:ubiquinone oxidoreductase subunit F
MNEIYYGVICFLGIQFILVTLIVITKKTLLPGGEVSIEINITDLPHHLEANS